MRGRHYLAIGRMRDGREGLGCEREESDNARCLHIGDDDDDDDDGDDEEEGLWKVYLNLALLNE